MQNAMVNVLTFGPVALACNGANKKDFDAMEKLVMGTSSQDVKLKHLNHRSKLRLVQFLEWLQAFDNETLRNANDILQRLKHEDFVDFCTQKMIAQQNKDKEKAKSAAPSSSNISTAAMVVPMSPISTSSTGTAQPPSALYNEEKTMDRCIV
jgi:hypothetical protein